ncbi:MAG TPA: CBS domain-containing protein [Kofleriaceae bacterium]|nr:CBS domain-containing protein [Kofleriaceae bacterium]
MRVHEIMTKQVRAIAPDADAEAAHQLMHQDHIHHLVITEGSRIVGVISERDLGGAHGASVRQGKHVRDLMTREPMTIEQDETVRRAANVLRGNEIGCLPVVDGKGHVVGMLTATDFLDMIGRGMEEPPRENDRKTMRDRGPNKAARNRAMKSVNRIGGRT